MLNLLSCYVNIGKMVLLRFQVQSYNLDLDLAIDYGFESNTTTWIAEWRSGSVLGP